MLTLAVSFFSVALVYALVGFGGGTSYLAILAWAQIPYTDLPKIALVCNLIVVSSGCWLFYRRGHFNFKLIIPLICSSIPLAFLGGLYPIKERSFLILLTLCLFIASLHLLFQKFKEDETRSPKRLSLMMIGGCLGFLSGLVGIGGGVFLAPILLLFNWAKAKECAATCSFFIWVNSLAGLIGQFSKSSSFFDVFAYWPLFLAVMLGGQIGSRLGNHAKFSPSMVRRTTGVLILLVATRLTLRLLA